MQGIILNNSGVLFDEATHTYWLADKQLSGLTGVIKRHLFPDMYACIPESVLKNAANRGSRIHSDCQVYDMFGIADSEEAQWYAELKKEQRYEVLDSEYLVTDNDHFATAIDKVLLIDDEIYLADIKTTYTLNKEYLSWQLSINAYLFELQNPHLKVKGLKGIWIKNGAKAVDIERKPVEAVKALLEAEINGDIFTPEEDQREDDDQVFRLIQMSAEITEAIEVLENEKKAIEERVKDIFIQTIKGDKWDNSRFSITRKPAYERVSFDSTKFKKEQEELYFQYLRKSEVKESYAIKLKT